MSIKRTISNITAPIKRILFDYQVNLTGDEHLVVRFKVTKDYRGDETNTLIDSENVTVNLVFPGAIPLYRLRNDTVDDQIDEKTSVYLYDILPIEGYAKFTDNVEKGDILIEKLYDEISSTSPALMVLRVSEILGSFDKGNLTYKYFNCSPYNEMLPSAVQDIIDAY